MKIRETAEVIHSTRYEQQQSIVEAIAELEQQREEGTIETPAYWIKKRALVRML